MASESPANSATENVLAILMFPLLWLVSLLVVKVG
jgi:hypothetical protein